MICLCCKWCGATAGRGRLGDTVDVAADEGRSIPPRRRRAQLSQEVHAAAPAARRALATRTLGELGAQMLPAALLAPTEAAPHLLLRILCAPPSTQPFLPRHLPSSRFSRALSPEHS